jgi:hypothetical protein
MLGPESAECLVRRTNPEDGAAGRRSLEVVGAGIRREAEQAGDE